MPPAANRFAAMSALIFVSAAFAAEPPAAQAASAEKTPTRAAPTRPNPPTAPAAPMVLTPLPGTAFGGVDYVAVADLAKRLDLALAWNEPGKKLTLSDATNRVGLEADGRDAAVNGMRVFLGLPVRARGGQLYVSRIDADRCLTSVVRPALGVAIPPAPKLIVLDPGHGGRDTGTENRAFGLKEKVLTLDIAQRLKPLLEAAGFKVVLVRTDDHELAEHKDVDLALRADFANRFHADLFVSIHFNAAARDTRGTEVFWLAPRAMRSTDSWGLHEDDAIADALPGNRHDRWNAALAAALHHALLTTLKTEDRGLKIAHWAVLRTLNCPGVLVEPAIITNESDARRVATPEFRQRIAVALAAGVRDYAALLDALRPKPPPVPAVSQTK